ncbi:uncharacterized protein [Typha latifolia]|uniref:uncharacterized protein n=1 Tax=Typha latifolia TaxID=4733 RepID=UPI003C2CF73C
MADLRSSSRSTGFSIGIWAAKLGLFIAGVVSVVGAAMLVLPYFVTFLATVLSRFWAPPYLFVAVHFIILVIWKLSDQKHHHHDQIQYAPIPDEKAKVLVVQDPPVPIPRNSTPEFWREISLVSGEIKAGSGAGEPDPGGPPKSEESCVTLESDAASTAESRSEAEKSVETAAADEVVNGESMEATWKAIMERSARPVTAAAAEVEVEVAAPPPTPARARRKEESVGADEMNRRFEDFIKKNYDQIRLQREESNRRRLETINRAVY